MVYSPYYHKLYFERDEQEAHAFMTRLINRLQPPAQATLPDVGRGRHAKMPAAKGFEGSGIDLGAR